MTAAILVAVACTAVAMEARYRARRAERAAQGVARLLVDAERAWGRRHDLATVEQEAAALLVATTTLTDIMAARQRLGE